MAKYFKIIGVLTLIGFIIYAIFDLVILIQTLPYMEPAQSASSILILMLILFVGPATGLLFISYGEHLEKCHARVYVNNSHTSVQNKDDDSSSANPLAKHYQKYQYQPASIKPTTIKEEDVSFENNILKIGTRTFNMQLQFFFNIKKEDKKVSFNINQDQFVVEFKTDEEANKFYELIYKN